MLAFALSALFGFTALAALLEIRAAIAKGLRRGRLIHAELAGGPAAGLPAWTVRSAPPFSRAAVVHSRRAMRARAAA